MTRFSSGLSSLRGHAPAWPCWHLPRVKPNDARGLPLPDAVPGKHLSCALRARLPRPRPRRTSLSASAAPAGRRLPPLQAPPPGSVPGRGGPECTPAAAGHGQGHRQGVSVGAAAMVAGRSGWQHAAACRRWLLGAMHAGVSARGASMARRCRPHPAHLLLVECVPRGGRKRLLRQLPAAQLQRHAQRVAVLTHLPGVGWGGRRARHGCGWQSR